MKKKFYKYTEIHPCDNCGKDTEFERHVYKTKKRWGRKAYCPTCSPKMRVRHQREFHDNLDDFERMIDARKEILKENEKLI